MSGYYIGAMYVSPEVYHHGVVGQKWGQRRYQNEDGSLTALGREHYGYSRRSMQRRLNKLDKELAYNKGDTARYMTSRRFSNVRKDEKKLEIAKSEIEKIKKQIDEILAMAGNQGYSVITKPANRFAVRYGKRLATTFFRNRTRRRLQRSKTKGTKYKVIEPSKR